MRPWLPLLATLACAAPDGVRSPARLVVDGEPLPIRRARVLRPNADHPRHLVLVRAEGARLEPGDDEARLEVDGAAFPLAGANSHPGEGWTEYLRWCSGDEAARWRRPWASRSRRAARRSGSSCTGKRCRWSACSWSRATTGTRASSTPCTRTPGRCARAGTRPGWPWTESASRPRAPASTADGFEVERPAAERIAAATGEPLLERHHLGHDLRPAGLDPGAEEAWEATGHRVREGVVEAELVLEVR